MTKIPAHERLLLLTLAAIQFCHILDFMVIMPLGPILMARFGLDAPAFGLLVASYSFSAALSGILATTFVDRFERKHLLLIICGIFALATLACGLADHYHSLLIARALTGMFGGMLGALVQTMIGDTIPFERRARASSFLSSAFALATVAGVPASLWLANHLGWRSPFVLIAVFALVLIVIASRILPRVNQHLDHPSKHWLEHLRHTLSDTNHQRALLFSGWVIFASFSVIPYITVYAVANVGITPAQIPWIYLSGGCATLFSSRWIGHWADRHGKILAYRLLALAAGVPLLLVTQLEQVSFGGWLLCTTSFFVLVSGRMIPAMAIITSAAQAPLRGTFMSLNSTVQSLAMGCATYLAGCVIQVAPDGRIGNYHWVGYFALVINLATIGWAARIKIDATRS